MKKIIVTSLLIATAFSCTYPAKEKQITQEEAEKEKARKAYSQLQKKNKILKEMESNIDEFLMSV